jgi:hypothetical protein
MVSVVGLSANIELGLPLVAGVAALMLIRSSNSEDP